MVVVVVVVAAEFVAEDVAGFPILSLKFSPLRGLLEEHFSSPSKSIVASSADAQMSFCLQPSVPADCHVESFSVDHKDDVVVKEKSPVDVTFSRRADAPKERFG